MDNEKLRDLLRRVHAELEQTESVDTQSARTLRDLMGEIQEVLDQSETPDRERYRAFGERLEDAARRFEVRHPTITAAIVELIQALPK